jgi:hypothetical protein
LAAPVVAVVLVAAAAVAVDLADRADALASTRTQTATHRPMQDPRGQPRVLFFCAPYSFVPDARPSPLIQSRTTGKALLPSR